VEAFATGTVTPFRAVTVVEPGELSGVTVPSNEYEAE
jgi:hypothetical protein